MKKNKNIKKVFQNLIDREKKSAESIKSGLNSSKKSGFTLVELIVVVTILSLLVSFSVVSMASVNRRKATRAGKLIDSELTTLASNAYSRDGSWRLEFEFDETEKCYVLTQQVNTVDPDKEIAWEDFSKIKLSKNVDISFGGDEYNESNSGGTHYISVSREKGCYVTDEGYFCDTIYVHSASKVVTIYLSSESGGHRVLD